MVSLSLSNFSQRDVIELITPAVNDDDVSEMLKRIAVMKLQEDTTYRCQNMYNNNNNSQIFQKNNNDELVNSLCRSKMCQWFYQVADSCELSRETVAIAMSYADRFVCTKHGSKVLQCRKQYQLVTMTALYMAIKLHEPAILNINVLVALGRGAYTEQDFVQMEMIILSALKWRVNGPTALSFVRCYLALLPPGIINAQLCNQILSSARYQTEIVVAESTYIDYLPSEIAMAAIANAITEINTNIVPSKIQQKLSLDIASYAGFSSNDSIGELQASLTLLLIGVSPETRVVSNNCRYQTHTTTKIHSGAAKLSATTSSYPAQKSPVRSTDLI